MVAVAGAFPLMAVVTLANARLYQSGKIKYSVASMMTRITAAYDATLL